MFYDFVVFFYFIWMRIIISGEFLFFFGKKLGCYLFRLIIIKIICFLLEEKICNLYCNVWCILKNLVV